MLTLEQKEFRKGGIGGSDAPAIVGLSPYKSAFQLFLEKRGEAPEEEEETLAMELGNILEEPVAQLYAKKTGRQIRRHPTRVSPDHPHMLVNVDRIIVNDVRGPGYLEIKTTNDWSGRGIQGIDDLPDHFYIQGQHGLAVTGWDWMSFAILIGGRRFVWCDINRNDDVITELIRQEGEFWERVQTGNPPPIDGSARTGELLKKLYPSDTGKTLVIEHPELINAAQLLVNAKALVKKTEADMTLYENQLKSAIGDASIARLPGFGEITWKQAASSSKDILDVDKLKAEFPEVYAACFRSETRAGSRRFLLKPTKE
ncbi:MAG: YqaJ viral recombinase family nuclease [Burkholderiales bacterium]